MNIHGVIIDGGSGVNTIFEEVMKKLKLKGLKPSPFGVRMVDQSMVDQRLVEPLSMPSDVVIAIGGIHYTISLIVIPMVQNAYPILLGKPWLKSAKVMHDWGSEIMTIKIGDIEV